MCNSKAQKKQNNKTVHHKNHSPSIFLNKHYTLEGVIETFPIRKINSTLKTTSQNDLHIYKQ